MSDSRYYSSKQYLRIRNKVQRQQKTIMFLLSALVSLGLVLLTNDQSFNPTQNYVLFILFFAIGLWVTEAIPPFAVGILIIGFLVFTMGQIGNMDVQRYVHTWSDGVIWLFLGGFFLAEGMKKSRLDNQLLSYTIPRLGHKVPTILLGFMVITAILSLFMSNTATTVMVLATLSPVFLLPDTTLQKPLLLGVAGAASFGGMGTIIGSAPNAIAVGAIESMGHKISFVEWMMYGIPVAVFLTILFWWILVKKYQLQGKSFDLSVLIPEEISDEESHSEEKAKKRIVLLVFVSTLLLWLTSEWTGIPVAAVSGIPIVFLTMLGIIDADDVRTLPWDTLMLVAGGLALGLAVQEQGLVDYYIQKLSNFEIQPVTVFLMFGMLSVLISNFMSNTAAVSIILPVAVTFVATISGTNPIITPVIVGLAASCALALPVSTPPNAVAYSYGKVEQKEFLYGGLVMGLAGPLIIIFWVLFLQWIS